MIRRLVSVLMALVLAVGIAGCGKKGNLEDPEEEKIRYPRQYPR
jgi:predicted small lipoprotein YifL